ncbi:hypothetical protein DF182_31325 [Chitinophaga flava]|uniref:Uncharacterized protein n=1 Tax=Chitinophaga flava TaxID=2259036 RepID=A0A365XNW4_9BACT|nr:hypothetical protein DF182_31325 [Chitinophaga flava]
MLISSLQSYVKKGFGQRIPAKAPDTGGIKDYFKFFLTGDAVMNPFDFRLALEDGRIFCFRWSGVFAGVVVCLVLL